MQKLLNNRVLSFLMANGKLRCNRCSHSTRWEDCSFPRVKREMSTASNLIKDLPRGPLDAYRKRATFDWKSLKLSLEGEDCIQYQVNQWSALDLDYINVHTLRHNLLT